jgi:hypothetical protein
MRRLLFIAVLGLVGCSGGESAKAVPLDKLPPGYLDKAKQLIPTAEFDAAGRKANGTYEIQGRDRKTGKKVEVEVDANGKAIID